MYLMRGYKQSDFRKGRGIGHVSKEVTLTANGYVKKCSTSLITRKMQIKTTVRCHLPPVRVAN